MINLVSGPTSYNLNDVQWFLVASSIKSKLVKIYLNIDEK